MNGNRNRAKAGVAVTGLHSLPFPKARCTEFKSRGGEVTFRATAMEKWPSRVQCQVTGTPRDRLEAGPPCHGAAGRESDLAVPTRPEKGTDIPGCDLHASSAARSSIRALGQHLGLTLASIPHCGTLRKSS